MGATWVVDACEVEATFSPLAREPWYPDSLHKSIDLALALRKCGKAEC